LTVAPGFAYAVGPRSETEVVVRTRTLVVAVGLLVAAGGYVVSQTPPPPAPVPGPGQPYSVPPPPTAPSDFPPPAPTPPTPPAPPAEKSIDRLLDDLEAIRAQKAELLKREQELMKDIRQKLEKQAERAARLGIVPAKKDAAVPDRVGRIVIEGADEKAEKKIMDLVNFRPGQVLQYPEVEGTRLRLHKAGFELATVAVEASGDDGFVDILIRVSEVSPAKPPPAR
jgi:hypothetical protein